MLVGAARVGDRSCIHCSLITVSADIMRGGMAKRHSITVRFYEMSLYHSVDKHDTTVVCIIYCILYGGGIRDVRCMK